jgi:pimeloyl-ACP methyl ester carboxylesterase
MHEREAGLDSRANRLHGAVDAAAFVLDRGLGTLEGVHTAISRKSFAPLGIAPGVAQVSGVVRWIHDGFSSLAYSGVRTALAATAGAAKLAARLTPPGEADLRPGSPADLMVAALNGFAGDRLAREGNPLATKMSLRQAGREVPLDREALAAAFPDPSSHLVVFLHGLACNESGWKFFAERHHGGRETSYGSRLQADLGVTPLYLRYNSGLRISHNGRALADLLDRLLAAWPVPVDQLTLVGHSMGGLVIRSACHHGQGSGLDWIGTVRRVIFLGAPHHGAPLEKATNVAAWLLGLTDVTRPFADFLNDRSAGIKDLRFGSLLDDDWQGVDPDAFLAGRTGDVPFLESATHYFVAATVTRDPRHPLGVAVGDLLVREPSASIRRHLRHTQFTLEHGRHFGPLTHLELLNHPDVYEELRRWVGQGAKPTSPAPGGQRQEDLGSTRI